ncbi:MAG: hypothetical protein JNL11_17400 [Bdellovibrionaceae bacterium]|nr:hypothetical protein [Pseudobdellovibrionaceae bacterium]
MSNFGYLQQKLVDAFKQQLKDAADEIIGKYISEFYTDVSIHAELDAHLNFKNLLEQELLDYFVRDITESNRLYAEKIRKALLEQHKDALQNKIIEDLKFELSEEKDKYIRLARRL